MFSRDLDSIPSHREVAAVSEFVNATLRQVPDHGNINLQKDNPSLHIMRDSMWHDIPILGMVTEQFIFQNIN